MVGSYDRKRMLHNSKRNHAPLSSEDQSAALQSEPGIKNKIPAAISFESIVEDATCPPVTVRDFMNYLLYVEHAAENLQFYLWHQDFVKRFNAATVSDISLAPEWTTAQQAEVVRQIRREVTVNAGSNSAAEYFKDTAFEKKSHEFSTVEMTALSTPPYTPLGRSNTESTYATSAESPEAEAFRFQAHDAFAAAGLNAPFTIQPYREEIDRIIATYIMNGAPRQLNLSDRDRRAVLHALSYTTHPSAMRIAFQAVKNYLRFQSHPNFIRWSICNGNPPRIAFARGLGIAGIVGGFAAAIILTLGRVPRRYRVLGVIGWFIGVATLVMGYRGMCICMYSFGHRRHIRPWELFLDEERESSETQKRSFDSFGTSNSFEQEPWVNKYKDRNIVRKIFDRETWIQDPSLRAMQDKIFLQALVCALLVSGSCTAVFVVLPAKNLF